MKVTWIRDNANDRIMPLSLFPDATKAQIDSLSLQDGVPASVSTFLVEKDGKRILFDAGMGAPDSKLPEGLKSLNMNPADIDYLFITHFHGAALQLKYPEICATYDMDKSGAVKSRKHYVQYAREKGLVIAGMHLPVPAFMK